MPESDGAWTIRRVLEWTAPFLARKEVDSPRLCAELLLSHVLGVSRISLYTDHDRPLKPEQLAAYRELVRRAGDSEPVAYLTGIGHFFNLQFQVNRDVLIPRPDTETLVEQAIAVIRREAGSRLKLSPGTPGEGLGEGLGSHGDNSLPSPPPSPGVPGDGAKTGWSSPRILDLCTGSGCIAAAIAQNVKTATVLATDVSEAAIAIARENIRRLNLAERVTLETGDLFEPVDRVADRQPFHMILGNPPYIAAEKMATLDRNVRDYEPKLALDGGPDGLDFHRRILAAASNHLVSGGYVFLEIAFDQGDAARRLAAEHSRFADVRIVKDHGRNDRVLTARFTG